MNNLKMTVSSEKEIVIDSYYLDNLEEKVTHQYKKTQEKENLINQKYLYNITEIKQGTLLLELNFFYEESKINKKIKEYQEKNKLQDIFVLQDDGFKKKVKERIVEVTQYTGKVEVSVIVFKDNNFIKLKEHKQDVKELDPLIKRLENKQCFEIEQIIKQKVKYREIDDDEDVDVDSDLVKSLYSGDLIYMTIDEYFRNRNNIDILGVYPIYNKKDDKCRLVYPLKKGRLISKELINRVNPKALSDTASKLYRIDRLDLFKSEFYVENDLTNEENNSEKETPKEESKEEVTEESEVNLNKNTGENSGYKQTKIRHGLSNLEKMMIAKENKRKKNGEDK